MILDELVLHNFGAYRGQHRAVLTPRDERPIVLFGALNGSGKTTFMEAMQLALYGRSAAPRGRQPYLDYLARSINRYIAPSEGAGVELAFRYWADGGLQGVRLKRTWHVAGKASKETFEVWRNDVLDVVATERWSEFVEDIIPNQISHLFFFDGEKIEGLADPTQSAELLRIGLHSLLGLDLVDDLIKSLGVVERRQKAASLQSPDQSALIRLEEELKALEGQRASLGGRIAEAVSQADQRTNEINRLEKEFERIGGHLYAQRKELEAKAGKLSSARSAATTDLLALAAADAPLLLVQSLLIDLRQFAVDPTAADTDARIAEYLRKRDAQIIKKVTALGVSRKRTDELRDFLERTRPSMPKGDRTPVILDASKLVGDVEMNLLVESVKQGIRRLDAIDDDISACDRNLAAIPPEEAVQRTLAALDDAQKHLNELVTRRRVLEEELSRIVTELGRKEKIRQSKLEQIAEQALGNQVAERVLKHSARSRETLRKYREEIAQRHMSRLEALITGAFARLHRKKASRHVVSIDRDTYELRVRDEGGRPIQASELSAGERQLLAVSVLWALAQASGRRLPTVIDTPLGRLDGPHRQLLVDHYFPFASHQVILFSTDEEVNGDYYRRLAPAIGREYTITYDEGKRTSAIVDGYLTQAALAA